MAQITSQADQRRPVKYTDQHGRKWFAEVEKSTGQPCIPLQPEFVAPIVPPKKYVRTHPDLPGKVEIDYRTWVKDLQDADREWWRTAQIVGAAEHKEHYDPHAPFSQTILNKMGERPRVPRTRTPANAPMGASALVAIAAQQGNGWVLGLEAPEGKTYKMPAKLAEYFAKPVTLLPEFADEFEGEAPVVEEPKKRGPGRPRKAELAVATAEE